jgi:phosphatidylglycerophosphatase A
VFFWSAVTLGDGNRLRRYMDDSDPQTIVSDELAGPFLAFLLLVGIGHSVGQWLILALLGFVAFRIFDVLKPFGVRRLESLPAGWGILADDLLAGLYAALAVRLLLLLGTPFTGLAG